ncbi:MAG: hypothetical protein JWP14_3404 [Frankiales bacterium]|nr:hypothetical protein [Frankiales bacterium]
MTRPSVLDMRAGGWVCRAAVYSSKSLFDLALAQQGIREGIAERAAGHEVTAVEWWLIDEDIPARLRQLQAGAPMRTVLAVTARSG